jgi:hypothetical protein
MRVVVASRRQENVALLWAPEPPLRMPAPDEEQAPGRTAWDMCWEENARFHLSTAFLITDWARVGVCHRTFRASDTNLSLTVESALLDLRTHEVRVPKSWEVREYLLRYTDVIPVILQAVISARQAFGQQLELTLECYRDPEATDAYLTMYARPTEYDDRFLERIHALRAGYESQLTDKSGWFLLTTDFRPPGVTADDV